MDRRSRTQLKSIVGRLEGMLDLSCGDEVRDKGCYTARGEHQDGGRGGATLSNDDEQALEDGRCNCARYEPARQVIEDLKELA